MNKTYIIAGGDFDGFFEKLDDNDLIIAADRGYSHCLEYGINPDLIIGDFDSADKPDLSNVIKLNPVKDETDTKSAVLEAVDKGFKDITIYGALGGRISHSLANIRLALEFKKKGINVEIKSKSMRLVIVEDEFSYQMSKEDDFYVSIFALSDEIRGLSIKGLYYQLDDYQMSIDDSLGVSNETCGKDFTISLDSGYILIVFEDKNM